MVKPTLAEHIRRYLDRGGSLVLFANFAQVHTQTVLGWLKGKQKPVGPAAPRVAAFFSALSIPLPDPRFRTKHMLGMALIFAHSLLTAEELAAQLRMPVNRLKRILSGNRKMTSEAEKLLEPLLTRFNDDVFRCNDELRKKCGVAPDDVTGHTKLQAQAEVLKVPVIKVKKIKFSDLIVASVAHHAQAMLPLAEALLSDEFTPADRERVRELAGAKTIFLLANALNGLCGERARNEQKNKENR